MNAMKSGGTRGIRTSVIISVLESYAVVRAQCRHLSRILPPDWELILLDDGSQPPIAFPKWRPVNFTQVHTRNFQPWTQPIARNLGTSLARGDYLLLTDIDHILTSEAVRAVQEFRGSRMFFSRSFAILSEDGHLVGDRRALREAGWTEQNDAAMRAAGGVHQNTFAIRRELFLDAMNGGYDESLCAGGRYGGDDVEFNHRYGRLVDAGLADRDVLGPEIHVYPDAAANAEFHGLSRS